MPQPITRDLTDRIEHLGEVSSWTYAALVDAIELAVREWGRDETEAFIARIIDMTEKVA